MEKNLDPKREQDEKRSSLMKGFHEALKAQEGQPPRPNELDSTCGVTDDELVRRFREAIRRENKASHDRGLPVTGYDRERKASYIEYPDGRRVYGDKA